VKNDEGKNILFVTPFNRLGQEFRIEKHESVTLHCLLGLNVDGNTNNKSTYDISKYDVICFDELMLYGPN
jgi:hypothetical protein